MWVLGWVSGFGTYSRGRLVVTCHSPSDLLLFNSLLITSYQYVLALLLTRWLLRCEQREGEPPMHMVEIGAIEMILETAVDTATDLSVQR